MTSTSERVHLSTVQTQALRRRLREELAWRRDQLLRLQTMTGEVSGADDTWEELAVSVTAAERAVAELAQALDRLAGGAYGRCCHCEVGIPFDRLEIRPLARLCIGCQRRYEAA